MVESTKVFVHGNPETSAIWSLLVNELHKNGINKIILLTPPGFGAPTPKGWSATVREYRDAAQPAMTKLGERFAAASPQNGLAIIAANDQFAGSAENQQQVAAGVNAKVANITDAGHWWMIERPALAASILIEHWKSFNN